MISCSSSCPVLTGDDGGIIIDLNFFPPRIVDEEDVTPVVLHFICVYREHCFLCFFSR